MTLKEFTDRCAAMGIKVVQEFEEINAVTLIKNGENIADAYLDHYGRFTTCYAGTRLMTDDEMKKAVYLLAEFTTSREEEE